MERPRRRLLSPDVSNAESSHHQEQATSSMSARGKDKLSQIGTPKQRRDILQIVQRNTPRSSPHTPQTGPSFTTSSNMVNTSTKMPRSAMTTSKSAMSHEQCAPQTVSTDGSPKKEKDGVLKITPEYVDSSGSQAVNMIGPSKIEQDGVMTHGDPDCSKKIMPPPKNGAPKMEYLYSCDLVGVSMIRQSESERYGVMGDRSPEAFNNRKCQHTQSAQGRTYGHCSSDDADHMPSVKPYDICPKKHGLPGLKAPLFVRNRDKRKDLERSITDTQPSLLRPGMVLLKNYITHADQIKIIKICRELGVGHGGFYRPGYSDGAKMCLHMMCLGKDWDPQSKSYGAFRSFDGAAPPILPAEFTDLVSKAIQASHTLMQDQCIRNPDKAIPPMQPDICIVNFYSQRGKLGLHQDRDESHESIKNGLPVVSFSIGDSAEFLYGETRDVDKAEKILLKSGDVLIFGGRSRLIFHGVPSIIQDSAPKFLSEEADLRPGRLNLTFRKY